METQKFELKKKIVRNCRSWFLSVPRVSVPREKKSPWLRQYQQYISNWCINVKIFMSTITWKSKILNFFSKSLKLNIDLYSDLCWRAEINIQVGLNMHLYDDIGDASLSLRGPISLYLHVICASTFMLRGVAIITMYLHIIHSSIYMLILHKTCTYMLYVQILYLHVKCTVLNCTNTVQNFEAWVFTLLTCSNGKL